MQKKKVNREDFLMARTALRDRFNALMPLIHVGKEKIQQQQRENNYDGLGFSNEELGLGADWTWQSTIIAVALAHSKDRLHMKKFQSKMIGHEVVIDTLEDQSAWLDKQLDTCAKLGKYAAIDEPFQDMIKLVAFSIRPELLPYTPKVAIEEEAVTYGIPEFALPVFSEIENAVSV